MLKRLIEYAIISKYNGMRAQRLAKAAKRPVASDELPPDYTILGDVLPWPDKSANDPIIKELHDRGIVALPAQARLRHIYILGATGTGKTNLLLRLIESDIKSKRAFCVIDLRGDLIDRVMLRLAHAAAPEKWRERLLLVDLRDRENAVGFNPLAGDGDVHGRVLHLLSVLKAQSESWGTQFPETMRNCLLALASTGWTLLEVEPLLTNASFRAQVLSQVSDVQVRGFFTRFDAMGKHNQLAYSQPVLNKITPLLSVPAIRNVLGQKRSLSFRDLIDEHPGMAVLVALGVDRLHDASHLVGGLFLSSFQSAVMSRADQPEADRVPVHLYVDEFENLATDRFHQIVSEGRRLGLGLTLSHQNITQLAPEMRHALRNNVRTQAYFQTGAQDAAELVKEIGGKNREEVRQCLMRQETGEAFLVRRGQAPTRMKVRLCPDPVVDASRVDALRSASAQTYARPVAEVERELEDRFNDLAGLHVSNSASDGATKGSPSKYEILDAKAESFPPRKTATNTAASGKAEPRAEGTAPTKRPPKKVAPRKTSKTKADRTDDNAG